MRANESLQICGESCTLVPYCKCHVEKYHAWMQDEELLRLTSSEPLSVDEEYDMQQSWQNDKDKCTFIILQGNSPSAGENHDVDRMVGDVNIFLNEPDDSTAAEIEIMIAVHEARRKSIAFEALALMMQYANTKLGLKKFIAKIAVDNEASIRLFKKLEFIQDGEPNCFNELAFIKHVEYPSEDNFKIMDYERVINDETTQGNVEESAEDLKGKSGKRRISWGNAAIISFPRALNQSTMSLGPGLGLAQTPICSVSDCKGCSVCRVELALAVDEGKPSRRNPATKSAKSRGEELEKINAKARREILKENGITFDKEEIKASNLQYRKTQSLEQVFCDCVDVCVPETCQCIGEGIGCYFDTDLGCPCKCHPSKCQNEEPNYYYNNRRISEERENAIRRYDAGIHMPLGKY
eukprot:m.8748 g.8748  ORF g.8748 m.8748 type:complete len:409 (+) comp3950_c0_seq2:290-1516(+)